MGKTPDEKPLPEDEPEEEIDETADIEPA
jgi:hypothetical protein